VAIVRNTAQKIPKVHHLFQGSISSLNLGLTQADRSALLAFAKPANWSAILEKDATIHTPKFEEQEQRAIGNRTAELRTPTLVTVRQDCVGILQLWRNCIVLSLNVSGWWIVNVGMHWSNVVRGECDAVIAGGMDMVKGV
jgi:hypothetical protein